MDILQEKNNRRELRRRNILENSENRLKLLLNQESKPANNTVTGTNLQSNKTLPLLQSTSPVKEEISQSSSSNDAKPEIIKDEISDNGRLKQTEFQRQNCHQIHSLPKILSENKSSCRKIKTDGQPVSLRKPNSLLQNALIYRKLTCIVLAIVHQLVINICSSFAFSQYFLMFLVVLELQFAITEIGQFYDVDGSGRQQQPSPNRLTALLTLYGFKNIKYVLIYYNTLKRYVEDFAVYMFVFCVCHWLMREPTVIAN